MDNTWASAFIFLCGIIAGYILALGLKYPVYLDAVEATKLMCVDFQVKKVNVGVTGKIYRVTCADGTIIQLG